MSNEKTLRQLTEELIIRDELIIESEKTFKTLFFINPVPMCLTLTLGGKFIMVNKAFEELSEYNEKDLIGKTAIDVGFYVNPLDRNKIVDTVELTGSIKNLPVQAKTKSGKLIDTEFSTTVIKLNGINHFITVILDVTDRNRNEEALRESEEKLSSAFNINPIPTAISDFEDGRFSNVNEAFLELFSYTREEVIGKTSVELGIFISLQDRNFIKEIVKEKGSVRNIEVKMSTKNGDILDMLFSASYIDHIKKLLVTVGVNITKQLGSI